MKPPSLLLLPSMRISSRPRSAKSVLAMPFYPTCPWPTYLTGGAWCQPASIYGVLQAYTCMTMQAIGLAAAELGLLSY